MTKQAPPRGSQEPDETRTGAHRAPFGAISWAIALVDFCDAAELF
jgi:hypothetical protein